MSNPSASQSPQSPSAPFWKTKHFWTDGWGSVFLAIFIALFIRWGFFEAYVIPSGSMLPSLLIHDHIFVNKMIYGVRFPFSEKWIVKFSEPQAGDVVVFKYPMDMSVFYVKRVVAVEGDTLFYDNGILYVNDKPQPQVTPPPENKDFSWLRDEDFGTDRTVVSDYIHMEETLGSKKHSILLRKEPSYLTRFTFGPIKVPPNHLFVMGDNRDNSNDSRMWKRPDIPPEKWHFLPKDYILGRAAVVWLSCEETLPVLSMICNPLTVRWTRFGHFVN